MLLKLISMIVAVLGTATLLAQTPPRTPISLNHVTDHFFV